MSFNIGRSAVSVGVRGFAIFGATVTSHRCFAEAKKSSLSTTSSIKAYVSQFPSPGIMYFTDGKTGVSSDTGVDVRKYAADFKKMKNIEGLVPDIEGTLDRATLNQIKQESVTDTDGVILGVGKEIFIYGMNSKKTENLKRSMDFLQENISQEERFWMSESGSIVKLLQKNHEILFDQIFNDTSVGHFRTVNSIVFKKEDFEQRSNPSFLLKKYNGTREDHMILNNILGKMQRVGDPNVVTDNLTPREEQVLSKISYLPPKRKEVPRLMQEFEQELKDLYRQTKKEGKVDYVKLAAFAHQRIVAIHPFTDGNGRVARSMMNALLIQGGFCPVVFLNNDSYTEALTISSKEGSTDHFEAYLRTCIKTTNVAFRSMLRTANLAQPVQGEDSMSLPSHSGYPPKV